MFDFLQRMLTKNDKEAIAKLISVDADAFEQFEKAYQEVAIDGFFGKSSKDAVAEANARAMQNFNESVNEEELNKLCDRIVDELTRRQNLLPAPENEVTREEIARFPVAMRPQLSGSLMKVDIGEPSSVALLSIVKQYLETNNPRKKHELYGMFRGGLDSLDLDSFTYEMLGRSKNSIGNWFYQLKEAADKHSFFKIPETKIIKVPMPILQLSRIEFFELTLATKHIVNEFCMKAFDLDVTKKYFIKTGVFSSKFDFRNAVVQGEQEVRELGEYLLYISFLASQMSSYLSGRPMYGANTTNEWVVREYIEDVENNPCIYHGMPLHTEYRFFVDFDTDEILGVSPYWRPDVMKKRFGDMQDKNDPDMIHDYITYTAHEETLMKRYHDNVTKVSEEIAKLIPDVNLEGQWSLDVMQNGDDFYLIDMATADTSALNDVVDPNKIRRVSFDIREFLPAQSK